MGKMDTNRNTHVFSQEFFGDLAKKVVGFAKGEFNFHSNSDFCLVWRWNLKSVQPRFFDESCYSRNWFANRFDSCTWHPTNGPHGFSGLLCFLYFQSCRGDCICVLHHVAVERPFCCDAG